MDHIPDDEGPDVARAAHAVVRDAIAAGVYVFAGGVIDEPASVVSPDGSVHDGAHPTALAGATVIRVDSRDEAVTWATKIAAACRCDQEVWEFGRDAERDDAPGGAGD